MTRGPAHFREPVNAAPSEGSRQAGILNAVRTHPVIAAVRSLDSVDHALRAPVTVVFLMTGDIFTIRNTVARIRDAGKQAVIDAGATAAVTSHEELWDLTLT